MKAPNGKSILANRATVSISASVYDRRALDSTSNRSLVNSLNHLTFLTSSSVKVRDAMIQDGAIERLVGILYECQNPKNKEEEALFAWKWVLSLQCLVLAGTRGSEKMRAKLVHAGIVPVLATILDNHFLGKKNGLNKSSNIESSSSNSNAANHQSNNEPINTNANAFSANNSTPRTGTTTTTATTTTTTTANTTAVSSENEFLRNDVVITDGQLQDSAPVHPILHSQVSNNLQPADAGNMEMQDLPKADFACSSAVEGTSSGMDDDMLRLLKKVEYVKFLEQILLVDEDNDLESMMNSNYKDLLKDEYFGRELARRLEVSNILQLNHSKNINGINFSTTLFPKFEEVSQFTVPRGFENGLIVPTADDVIWCLQLLAFISKYTYLRHTLSNTYVINGLSYRSRNCPPPLEVDTNGLEIDEFMSDGGDDIDNDSLCLKQPKVIPFTQMMNTTQKNVLNKDIINQTKRLFNLQYGTCHQEVESNLLVNDFFAYFNATDNLERAKYEVKIDLDYSRIKYETFGRLRILNRRLYQNKKRSYAKKWNYDDSWDELERNMGESDLIDKDMQPFLTLNIFPLVERFTVKDWFSDDICYWAAVVVRNANRKDESMGGRRQCAHFSCGKWEDHPKQFSKCRRCKRAKYCSKECQTKAWVFHKHWCVPAPSTSDASTSTQHERIPTNITDTPQHRQTQ